MANLMNYKLGVDLGGTNIKAGVLDNQNNIIATHSMKTFAQREWKEVVDDIVLTIKTVISNAKLTIDDFDCIGIGSPGAIDTQNGIVVYANNFNNWVNIPLAKTISESLNKPVKLSNDANCAALGEFVAGAALEYDSAVLITLGTGVGGGVVMDGKIFEGGGPAGVELGHTVLSWGGERCTCGRKGCFEAYSSATALIRDAKIAAKNNPNSLLMQMCNGDLNNMNARIPFDAKYAGDEIAKELVEIYITHLGEGIVNLVNVFRPKVVLISGGISGEKEKLTDPLNEFVSKYVFAGKQIPGPPVLTATLGNNAGMVGAANL